MADHQDEVNKGERFRFGDNWSRFVEVLDDDRVSEAARSLQSMLGIGTLEGMKFLDIGSGSGLFSLAAHSLGAIVHSFDYDPRSVETTRELRRRFAGPKPAWTVEEGSVLDREYMLSLGKFDVVYSWGVLHHTGEMWLACDNAILPVRSGGTLFIALYNDQGLLSNFWRSVKRAHCSGWVGRYLTIGTFVPTFALAGFAGDVIRRRNPFSRYREYRRNRGMSLLHDWVDWLGGYPFETANPGEVVRYYLARGFMLKNLVTRHSIGCNEFVFERRDVQTTS